MPFSAYHAITSDHQNAFVEMICDHLIAAFRETFPLESGSKPVKIADLRPMLREHAVLGRLFTKGDILAGLQGHDGNISLLQLQQEIELDVSPDEGSVKVMKSSKGEPVMLVSLDSAHHAMFKQLVQLDSERVFKQIDTSGDGELSCEELSAALRKDRLLAGLVMASGKNASKLFAEMDTDGSGGVVLAELQHYLESVLQQQTADCIIAEHEQNLRDAAEETGLQDGAGPNKPTWAKRLSEDMTPMEGERRSPAVQRSSSRFSFLADSGHVVTGTAISEVHPASIARVEDDTSKKKKQGYEGATYSMCAHMLMFQT